MAYRADIEIAVRGAQELKRLQNGIKSSSDAVDSLNSSLNAVANLLPRSFNNINKIVGEAAANFNKVALGTKEASDAARDYYQANKILNNSLRERLKLLDDIQKAERGTVLANIKASQAARAASGFGAFSAGIDIPTQKSIRRNREKRATAEAAAETANQIQKLTDRQEEFTARTDAAAQAAARQTAAFYRQARIAKEVAKINAAAPPAQLLLAPAAPGAPAMGGGARRRVTGAVERLGGARTADEAAATLRLAQATDAFAKSSNKIDPQYNRFLPSSELLNATGRGLQQLTTNQEAFNNTVASGIRFQDKYNQELERRRRLGIGGISVEGRNLEIPSNRKPGTTAAFSGQFPVAGPMNLGGGRGQSMLPGSQGAARSALGAGLKGRVPGAVSSAIIGGGFPLLFGQGAAAAGGGALGGLAGGLLGGGFGFALSIAGTAIGDIVGQAQKVKQLGIDLGFSAQQTNALADAFKKANTDADKFTAVVQNIRGLGLELEDQAELIRITTTLTEKYGGQFDKVGNAITSALESGKVSQGTLNQLTSQGINVQQALADKLGVSRDRLLEMAKKGKISVQDLINTLVDVGNKGVTAAAKPASGFAVLSKATKDLGTALKDLGQAIVKALKPALDWLSGALGGIIGLAAQAIQSIANMLSGGTADTVIANARARKRLNVETGAPMKGNLTVKQTNRLRELEKEEQELMAKPKPLQKINVKGLGQAAPAGGQTTKERERESRVPELQIEVNLAEKLAALNMRIAEAKNTGNKAVGHALEMEKILEERSAAIATINLQDIPTAEKNLQIKLATMQADEKLRNVIIERNRISAEAATAAEKVLDTSRKEIEAIQSKKDREKEYAQLIREGVLPANAENYLQTKELVAAAIKAAEAAILEAEARGASADAVDRLRKGLDAIRGKGEAATNEAKKGKTSRERLQEAADEAKGRLNELIDPVNMIKTAAAGIGDAFAQSFEGIVSGTMTAQEALANFFKSIGDMFVQMAAKIIAEMITMYAIKTILGLFANGGTFGQGSADAITQSKVTSNVAANGAFFSNGIAKFAAGGAFRNSIVSSPTLFKFADGGTTNLGVMGEAGPEAIMPLRRNSAGRLGVEASGLRDAMGAAPGSAGGSPVLNMSFETSTINGVEYVSRDQLEAAMAETRRQASRDGAKRGMTMTLDRIQQSPQTRSRLGLR